MSFDILETLNSTLGGPIVRQLSSVLGETEDNTRAATRSIGPALLAGLLQHASTATSAADLFRAVTDARVDPGLTAKLGSILSNRGSAESLRELGESLAGVVFGNRTGAVTNAVSQAAGVKPASALSLLSFATPLLFGMLKKQTTNNGLDIAGLASLLIGQRHSLEKSGLDDRIVDALGTGPGAVATYSPTSLDPQKLRTRHGWTPWAVAAGLAVVALLFLFNRTGNGTREGAAQVPTAVYFESGDTAIDAADRIKIASIATTVKRENRPVAITGYTDGATAVRDALVAEGVAESKIVMTPPADATRSETDREARRVDIELR